MQIMNEMKCSNGLNKLRTSNIYLQINIDLFNGNFLFFLVKIDRFIAMHARAECVHSTDGQSAN